MPGGTPAGAFRPAVFRRPCRRNVRPRESYTGLVSYGGVPGCGELLSGGSYPHRPYMDALNRKMKYAREGSS